MSLRRGIIASQAVSQPIGCAVALTGDYAAAFGGLPAQIAGQTASATNSSITPPQLYIATTDLANSVPLWEAGTRLIEGQEIALDSFGIVSLLMASPGGSHGVAATYNKGTGIWYFTLQAPVGNEGVVHSVEIPGTEADVPAVGLDAAGNAYGYLVQNGVTSAQIFGAPRMGFFAASSVGLAASVTLPLGASGSVRVVSHAPGYAGKYPDTGDWCGNELPEPPPFDPMVFFSESQLGAFFDVSDLSTLFQDSAGTIPVEQDGDIVGLMLDKSGNGRHASQSTTAAKLVYHTDGDRHWLEYDSVDGSLPFAAAAYSSDVCFGIAYRLDRADRFGAWSSSTTTSSNAIGLSNSAGPGTTLYTPVAWAPSAARVNGADVNASTYRQTLASVALSDCVGIAEGVSVPDGSAGWDTAPRQLINYGTQPKVGGRLYAYIEVERSDFGALRGQLEAWLAAKSGVTLP